MKLEIKYGLAIGLGIALWILGEFALGFHTTRFAAGQYSGYFSVIIPVIIFYLALRKKRDAELQGILTIKQGLKAGLKISLVAAVIIVVFLYGYATLINPQWMEHGLEFERDQMIVGNIPLDQIAAQLEDLKLLYSLPVQIGASFIGTILQGCLIAFFMTLIIKRTAPIAKN